jgi:hypothetical protein
MSASAAAGGTLSKIQECGLAVHVHGGEAAAADVAGFRVRDSENEGGGDRRVDGVAALAQDALGGVRPVRVGHGHGGPRRGPQRRAAQQDERQGHSQDRVAGSGSVKASHASLSRRQGRGVYATRKRIAGRQSAAAAVARPSGRQEVDDLEVEAGQGAELQR